MKNTDTTVGSKVSALVAKLGTDARSRGWRSTIPPRQSVGLPALGLLAVITVFVTGILVSDEGRGGALPGIFIPVAIGLFIVIGVCLWRSPLTAEGSELRDHIRGLEEYIELAEADRMRVLQSPQGALRDPVDVQNRDEALRLTERILPWAVLLGHEKEWSELLGRFYDEEHQPSWYSGRLAFSAAAFSSGISTVASRVSSSYSGSSSSGGSSGGGSSGGGGGGGGGGGV